MIRAQNAHAIVNAAFLMKFKADQTVDAATICFGGINPNFTHASATENLCVGKDLFTNETLKTILASLNDEIKPDWILPDASPEYRKNLAIALFYRFVLHISPNTRVSSKNASGAEQVDRPISSGQQSFKTIIKEWPLTEPIEKLEALQQSSGQAMYINDMPPIKDQLWAAFVIATKIGAKIGKIDTTDALALPGVHYFYSAKDIPGKNSFTPVSIYKSEDEEIFVGVDSEVKYYGQTAGVICAESMELAHYAANLVKIIYVQQNGK